MRAGWMGEEGEGESHAGSVASAEPDAGHDLVT